MAVITISRQVGSFGDEIAGLVAQKLEHELITKELIHNRAQNCDSSFKEACAAFEEETNPRSWFEHLFLGNPGYTALFEAMNFEFAARGDVVMVGRGAHLVLQGISGVLKCRIIAPLKSRVARVAKMKNMTMDQADRFVERYGKKRVALLESVYPYSPRDVSTFNLVINTDQFDPEEGACIIVEAARRLRTTINRDDRSRILQNLSFSKSIERAVKDEITTMTYRDIEISADENGVVTLQGLVADEHNNRKAARIVENFEGVTKVINNLKVVQFRI